MNQQRRWYLICNANEIYVCLYLFVRKGLTFFFGTSKFLSGFQREHWQVQYVSMHNNVLKYRVVGCFMMCLTLFNKCGLKLLLSPPPPLLVRHTES